MMMMNTNRVLFQNPLLRSAAAVPAPPSDRPLPVAGIRRLSDMSSLSQVMGGLTKSNPITNNTSHLWNDAKELRMMHTNSSMPAGLGAASAAAATSVGVGGAIRRYSTKSVRPLSPHLSVYKPQSSSMGSIFHRIAFMYLSGLIAFYYLVYIKMGAICLTYDSFNAVLFYTSKLNSFLAELSGVALLYYVYHGLHGFLQFRSGGIKTGLTRMLGFGKK